MFDYVAVIMAVFYAGLVALGVQQLYTAFQSKNKKMNMRNGVVAILTSSALLRSFYFTKVAIPTVWDDGFMMSLFIIPLWMQGVAISLLVVFYASTVYYHSSLRDWPLIICLSFNLIMLILDVSIATSVAGANSQEDVDRIMLIYCTTSALEDVILAALLVYFGSQFKHLAVNKHGQGNVLATWSERSVTMFDAMNWLLTCSKVFRAVFTLIFYLTPSLKGRSGVQYNGRHPVTSLYVLVFFIFAELLPSLYVFIILFQVDVQGGEKSYGKSNVHYRVIDGAVGGHPLDARLLSAEDKKIRIILSEEDENDPHQDNFYEEAGRPSSDSERYSSQSYPGPPGGRRQTPSAAESAIQEHGDIDTKGVFRGAFSPDEKSLVDDLMEQAAQERRRRSESDSSSNGNWQSTGERHDGVIAGVYQGFNRAPIPSFLRRTPSPGALHPRSHPGIKINAASPAMYNAAYQDQESPALSEGDNFFQVMKHAHGSPMHQDPAFQEVAEEEGEGEEEPRDSSSSRYQAASTSKYGEYVSPRDILLKTKSAGRR